MTKLFGTQFLVFTNGLPDVIRWGVWISHIGEHPRLFFYGLVTVQVSILVLLLFGSTTDEKSETKITSEHTGFHHRQISPRFLIFLGTTMSLFVLAETWDVMPMPWLLASLVISVENNVLGEEAKSSMGWPFIASTASKSAVRWWLYGFALVWMLAISILGSLAS